ncbi:hypothetical protein RUND412_008915 [Rhizina undulata]
MLSLGEPPIAFPKYLLPPLSFLKSKFSAASDPLSTSSSSSPSSSCPPTAKESKSKKSDTKYSLKSSSNKPKNSPPEATEKDDETNDECGNIHGNIEYLKCKHCRSDICFATRIISKGFIGRHGRAYLVNRLQTEQITLLPEMERPLVTGYHKVSDVACKICGYILGWKYVNAEQEDQRYKIGKYIIERERVTRVNCWDMPRRNPSATENPMTKNERSEIPMSDGYFDPISMELVEAAERGDVDSEDEDELEDMFLGIWTPQTAAIRGNSAAQAVEKADNDERKAKARISRVVAIGMIDANT